MCMRYVRHPFYSIYVYSLRVVPREPTVFAFYILLPMYPHDYIEFVQAYFNISYTSTFKNYMHGLEKTEKFAEWLTFVTFG
jgi:hypothetical protein